MLQIFCQRKIRLRRVFLQVLRGAPAGDVELGLRNLCFIRGQMRVINRSAAEREGSQCMEPISPTVGSTRGCMVYKAGSKAKGTTQYRPSGLIDSAISFSRGVSSRTLGSRAADVAWRAALATAPCGLEGHVLLLGPIDGIEEVDIKQCPRNIHAQPTGGHLFQMQDVIALGQLSLKLGGKLGPVVSRCVAASGSAICVAGPQNPP